MNKNRIKKFIHICLDIQIRFILIIVYFVVLLPVALLVKLFTDFLKIRGFNMPSWWARNRIIKVEEFLRQQ